MNWHDPRPGEWDAESERPQVPERLRRVERRLQAARPTVPSFDAAAWERIVAAADAQEPEIATLEKPFRQRGLSRSAGVIAAIWLSGVVVGSSLMFFFMHREPPFTSVPGQTPVAVAPAADTPGADAFERSAPGNAEPQQVSDRPAPPEAEPQPSEPHRFSPDRSKALRAQPRWYAAGLGSQSPLRPFGHEWSEDPISVVSLTGSPSSPSHSRVRLEQSPSQRQLASTFVPPPKTTPQRILWELMSDGETL